MISKQNHELVLKRVCVPFYKVMGVGAWLLLQCLCVCVCVHVCVRACLPACVCVLVLKKDRERDDGKVNKEEVDCACAWWGGGGGGRI